MTQRLRLSLWCFCIPRVHRLLQIRYSVPLGVSLLVFYRVVEEHSLHRRLLLWIEISWFALCRWRHAINRGCSDVVRPTQVACVTRARHQLTIHEYTINSLSLSRDDKNSSHRVHWFRRTTIDLSTYTFSLRSSWTSRHQPYEFGLVNNCPNIVLHLIYKPTNFIKWTSVIAC